MAKFWHDRAWEEYIYWQSQDKKTLKKINKLLESIERNGYDCIGKPERLKGNLSRYYSARIDEKNRLVFCLTKQGIEIVQCGTHYDDN